MVPLDQSAGDALARVKRRVPGEPSAGPAAAIHTRYLKPILPFYLWGRWVTSSPNMKPPFIDSVVGEGVR